MRKYFIDNKLVTLEGHERFFILRRGKDYVIINYNCIDKLVESLKELKHDKFEAY